MNTRVLRGLALIVALSLPWGCGSYPLPKVYVLGDPGPPSPGVSSERSFPVFFLPRASVPDYVDSTEIVRRTAANQLIASPSGRWGERVSIGVTDALRSALADQLPDAVVETHPSSRSDRRILVDVERFDIGMDGGCTVKARWEVTGVEGAPRGWGGQATVVETSNPQDDAGAAAAMTRATQKLAATSQAPCGSNCQVRARDQHHEPAGLHL